MSSGRALPFSWVDQASNPNKEMVAARVLLENLKTGEFLAKTTCLVDGVLVLSTKLKGTRPNFLSSSL